MAEVREVEVGYKVGGKVQVKKFDIQSDYEYYAAQTVTLDPDDNEYEEIDRRLLALKEQLDPMAQADFDELWKQRVKTGE